MVEDIITALSRFKSLFVIARNSSFTYKGKAVDVKQVGRELGVRYVLEGSVRKAGGRVRITGQLIDAGNGTHIWADKFDGGLDDIFELQDSVTSSVVGAIAPKLQQSEFERAKRKPTDNLTAYDHYLRGLSKMYQFKRESLDEASLLFQRAIELDTEFASPYAAAAFRYGARQTFGWGLVSAQEKAELIALARRAVELDKDDAIVLTYAGYALALVAQELEAGAALMEQATGSNPNLAIAWTFRGWVSVHLGNPLDAIGYFKKALRLSPLDPLDFSTRTGLAAAYFFSTQYAEASKWVATAVAANPEWLSSRRIAMISAAFSGDIDAAKAAWEVAQKMDPTQRISQLKQRFPLQRADDYARMAEGCRLAGMPE